MSIDGRNQRNSRWNAECSYARMLVCSFVVAVSLHALQRLLQPNTKSRRPSNLLTSYLKKKKKKKKKVVSDKQAKPRSNA